MFLHIINVIATFHLEHLLTYGRLLTFLGDRGKSLKVRQERHIINFGVEALFDPLPQTD
jgi:hypothetical protein